MVEGSHLIVITADQIDSRHQRDAVPGTLGMLSDLPGAAEGNCVPFERTAGDEIQGVVRDGTAAVAVIGGLTRSRQWRVGVGLGGVELPLPSTSRAARGPAFIAARRGVERAHRAPQPVAVEAQGSQTARGGTPEAITEVAAAEAALWLWLAVLSRRTGEGWEVTDLLAAARSQREVATTLGVSPSAVSQRLRAAAWQEANRGQVLCANLVDAAQAKIASGPPPSDDDVDQESS